MLRMSRARTSDTNMRFRLVSCASILFAVFVLTGCSANYTGERLFWKAQQLQAVIVKDPAKASPEQFAAAVSAFDRVIQKVPGTMWAARAQVSIGSLYAMERQYEKARAAYALVLQNYNQYKQFCLAARLATARTYELEQNGPEAITVYKDISEYYPWSVPGLESPLHIARMYEQRKDTEAATQAYERAVRMYTRLLPDAPTPELTMQIKGYLTLAYQRLGQWEDAVHLLQELAAMKSGVNKPLVLLTLASIYQTKLKETQKAQAVYTQLVEEFPTNPFAKAAKSQLERMGAPVPETPVETPAVQAPAIPSTPVKGPAGGR